MPLEAVTEKYLRREGLGHVREKAGGLIVIRMPGHHAFSQLSDCLFKALPEMQRGAVYTKIQDELFEQLEAFIGRNISAIGLPEAEGLFEHFARWFSKRSSTRRVYVPCLISRTPAPRFAIGPVVFEHIDQAGTSDLYPVRETDPTLHRRGFDDLLQWAREGNADWLARIAVDGCERGRGEEIAELAVDLAILALQLAAPYLDTRTMTRLDARRGDPGKRTLSEADGDYNVGWTRREPGMTIGSGTLADILQKTAPMITAVGNLVRSFASGSFRLPNLEQAWCDAAYWLHQALIEPLDTIAKAKLETSLEVLAAAESSRGSERRILEILSAFFDLSADDIVAPGSLLTARQFARNVVGDRSRILHGTWSTLSARILDRAEMETFVRTVLRTAAVEIESYATSTDAADNIDAFLNWVRHRRALSAAIVQQS